MRTELDNKIIQIKSTDNKEEINRLIEDYQPFVLNVITAIKKKLCRCG